MSVTKVIEEILGRSLLNPVIHVQQQKINLQTTARIDLNLCSPLYKIAKLMNHPLSQSYLHNSSVLLAALRFRELINVFFKLLKVFVLFGKLLLQVQ